MVVCEHDPRQSEFYIKRLVLKKETVKLRGKGTEHSGIEPAVKRKLLDTITTFGDCIPSGSSSPSSPSPIPFDSNSLTITDQTEQRPRKRLRRSADRDMSSISVTLSTGTIKTRLTRSTSRI